MSRFVPITPARVAARRSPPLFLTSRHRGQHDLSARERQVLQLSADGYTVDEIAGQLERSAYTIKTHVRKALWRLDAASRTHAVAIALREGLIT